MLKWCTTKHILNYKMFHQSATFSRKPLPKCKLKEMNLCKTNRMLHPACNCNVFLPEKKTTISVIISWGDSIGSFGVPIFLPDIYLTFLANSLELISLMSIPVISYFFLHFR